MALVFISASSGWASGRSDYEKGDYEKAREAFEAQVQKDPNDAKALYSLGNSLYQLKRYPEAEEAFGKAIEKDPGFAAAWYNQGLAQAWQHRLEDSLQSFQKDLEINPKDGDAKRNIEILEKLLKRQPQQQAGGPKGKQGQGKGPGKDGDQGKLSDKKIEDPKGKETKDGKKGGTGDDYKKSQEGEKAMAERKQDQARQAQAMKELGLSEKQVQEILARSQQVEQQAQQYYSANPRKEQKNQANMWNFLPRQQQQFMKQFFGKQKGEKDTVTEDW